MVKTVLEQLAPSTIRFAVLWWGLCVAFPGPRHLWWGVTLVINTSIAIYNVTHES